MDRIAVGAIDQSPSFASSSLNWIVEFEMEDGTILRSKKLGLLVHSASHDKANKKFKELFAKHDIFGYPTVILHMKIGDISQCP